MYPIFPANASKRDKHPLTLYMKPLQNLNLQLEYVYLKQLQLTIFLEHLHVGENTNPHFPSKKNGRQAGGGLDHR